MRGLEATLSRRTLLRGAALGGVGLATAAVIGCDDDDDDDSASTAPSGPSAPAAATAAPAAAAPAPEKTGAMVFARASSPPTLDPNTSAITSPTFHAIYDGLTRIIPVEGGSAVTPGLATSWETNPGDATTWVFHLREAEWSDGKQFTAEDVRFTFEYYLDADNKSRLISRVRTVQAARVIDERTVALTTNGTDPILPRRNGLPFVLPKHIFADPSITNPSEVQGQSPVGTGAYVSRNYETASSVELETSASGWRPTRGMDDVTVRWISETSTRLAGFQTGDIHFISGVPTIEQQRVGGFSGAVVAQPPSTSVFAWIHNNREEEGHPTNDGRVRQALNYALDAKTIGDVVWDGLAPVAKDQMVATGIFGHNPSIEALPYDPDTGRQLLKDGGFADGFSMDMEARFEGRPENKSATEASAGFWDDIGLSLSIVPIETNVWRDRLYGRETKPWPGAWQSNFTAQMFDASQQMVWLLSTSAMRAWNNPRFDEAFNAAQEELDEERRLQFYWDAVETMRMANQGPSSFIVEVPELYAYRSDVIADYVAWPLPEIHFDSVRPA